MRPGGARAPGAALRGWGRPQPNPNTRTPVGMMMAKLGDFRVNARKLKDGDWVDLGGDWDGLRLRVRAQGRAYFEGKARAEQKAAREAGGDITTLKDEVLDRIGAEAAGEHLLIDVAGLEDGGKPVTVDGYRKAMLEPDNAPLVVAVLVASSRLEQRARAEARQAEGFSAPPSAGG